MRVSMLALPLALITCEPQDGYVQRPEPKPLFGSSREAERQMAEARPVQSTIVRPVPPPVETPPVVTAPAATPAPAPVVTPPVATPVPTPAPSAPPVAATPAPARPAVTAPAVTPAPAPVAPPATPPSPTPAPPAVVATAPAAAAAPAPAAPAVAPTSSLPTVMPPAVSRPPLETQRGTALAPSLPATVPAGSTEEAPRMLLLPSSGGETPACQAGLKARGLKDNELWVMMREPAKICPGNGVSASRIREIAGLWREAGCTKHPPEEILRALNANRCR